MTLLGSLSMRAVCSSCHYLHFYVTGFNPVQRVSASSSSSSVRASQQEDNLHTTLQALQSKNRSPKKWLGQHYMLNQSINEKLVEFGEVKAGDLVLEVGPGTGSLTNVLVNAGAHVIAVEKDPDMAALVTERFRDCEQVEVVHEDFLKWYIRCSMANLSKRLFANEHDFKLAKVVCNLPFNITTDVVKQILPMGDIFSHMVLLLQDEAASRLVDPMPEAYEYRPITLFVNFFSEPQYKLKVDRSNFFPRPHVDAAIVSFRIKQSGEYPCVTSPQKFFKVVNAAFVGKRKMLRNSLQKLYNSMDIQNALKCVGLLESSRPHELSLEQFVAFYNALNLEQQGKTTYRSD